MDASKRIGKSPEHSTTHRRDNAVSYFGSSPEEILESRCKARSERLLRLPQIIGQKEVTPEQAELNRQSGKSPKTPRPYIQPLIPVSRASWWNGVKEGKYPQPMKLGSRTTVWRESDVVALVQQFDEAM